MCDECGFIFCPDNCPGYDGTSAAYGRPRGTCHRCGRPIWSWEIVYRRGRKNLCASCRREFDARREAADKQAKSQPHGEDLSFLPKK